MNKNSFNEKQRMQIVLGLMLALALIPFQNCSRVKFNPATDVLNSKSSGNGEVPGAMVTPVVEVSPTPAASPIVGVSTTPVPVCNNVSCHLTPLTNKPAVTTILMALGDVSNDQLVVNGASAQLIAETVIRYSSPKENPKILLLVDQNALSEDPEDIAYVKDVLLKRYDVTILNEPTSGVSTNDLVGFDLVWFNNPGLPMSSVVTYQVLLGYAGAIVMQGDDLSWGSGFDMSELTGLKNIDNGQEVICDDGVAYAHDNNGGEQYQVSIDKSKVVGVDDSIITFKYGNDIDGTELVGNNMEVLATAKGGPASCTKTRPAIVKRIK